MDRTNRTNILKIKVLLLIIAWTNGQNWKCDEHTELEHEKSQLTQNDWKKYGYDRNLGLNNMGQWEQVFKKITIVLMIGETKIEKGEWESKEQHSPFQIQESETVIIGCNFKPRELLYPIALISFHIIDATNKHDPLLVLHNLYSWRNMYL